MDDLEKLNSKRYIMWKNLMMHVKGIHDRGSKWTIYMEQLNKCRHSIEYDEVLDAILENEKLIRIGKK